jgi:uncharacterized protein with PIN domain
MKFIADSMLGKLAKWMRILGYDVEYFPRISDSDLVDRALETGLIILTRDNLLIRRKKARNNHFFVQGDDYRDQLRQIVKRFPPPGDQHIFTRCLICNKILEPVEKPLVKDKVPPYVFETQEVFSTCPSCQRIYWEATHKEHLLRHLGEILNA